MATRTGQKIKLLRLADILKKYTDEEHPLTATELCDKLAQVGVSAERKAIYDDIEQLTLYGMDIIQSRSAPKGYFLASRDFELPEVYLLADAVRSARFISAKKTRELVAKLDGLLSIHEIHRRDKHIFFDGRDKCDNEELFYLIDGINDAIEQGRKICFIYRTRSLENGREIGWNEKKFKISPYAMIWQDDHYYLIGNNEKYDNLLHLRIDRMHSLEITDEPSRSFGEVSEYTAVFDSADYTKKLFQMHTGQVQTVELRCDRSILEPILHRFSKDIFIRNVTENSFDFSVQVASSDAFISWILGYGEKIEVLSPNELRESVAKRANQVLTVYSKG